jgi:hypothetical protein
MPPDSRARKARHDLRDSCGQRANLLPFAVEESTLRIRIPKAEAIYRHVQRKPAKSGIGGQVDSAHARDAKW